MPAVTGRGVAVGAATITGVVLLAVLTSEADDRWPLSLPAVLAVVALSAVVETRVNRLRWTAAINNGALP